MASPVKAGGPTHMGIIDQYEKLELDDCIKEALDGEGHDLFYTRVRAVRLVQLDRKLPKYRRLGMGRIASLLYVSRGSVQNWWKAFEIGGIPALRNDTSGCGRSPKVSPETMEEIKAELLARNPQAEKAKKTAEMAAALKKAAEGAAGDTAAADGKAADGKAADGKAADGKAADGKAADIKAVDGGTGEIDWTIHCLACAVAADLVPDGEWFVGRDGVPRPGRRGWRTGRAAIVVPTQRRFRCTCGRDCKMPSGRKRKACECTPAKRCRCACCGPRRLSPRGPPHLKGCPARSTAPPHTTMPEEFHRAIKERTGVGYSRSQTYAKMVQLGLSPKTPTAVHANRASRRDVMRWQRRLRKRIDKLRAKGYKVVVMDEAHLVYNVRNGVKHWSLVGKRVRQTFTGSHKKATIFGALVEDGPQMFRPFAKADSYAFIDFLKELTAKFGKVAVIADRYAAHNSNVVKDYIRKNRADRPDRDIRMIWLPVGCPYLNAVEKCWNRLKRRVVVGEYHDSFGEMCRVASEFLRTTRFGYSIEKSLYCDPPPDMIPP